MKQVKKIKVYGKVQGVFFRASTKRKAEELGITGTVKNESDGTVLIEAKASSVLLDKFIAWCHEGPTGARVDKVEIWEEKEDKNYLSFDIKK